MIPKFPHFKPLELNDRGQVEEFTRGCPPYSDYNFTSLWMWDVHETIRVSRLHGNLAVRFSDYSTGGLFYSFIGTQNVNATTQDLLALSRKEQLQAQLKFIAEESAALLDGDQFFVGEDRDNFDYVYHLSDLKNYHGRDFDKKRNHVAGFLRTYPQAEARIIDLKDKEIWNGIFDICCAWQHHKCKRDSEFALPHELDALRKLFVAIDTANLAAVGVFVGDALVAFLLSELLDSEYALGHVMKADISISPGVYAYLMKTNAEILFSQGKRFFNYEQDLGFENLRIAKMRFRPRYFLKKYIVSPKSL